MKKGKKDQDMLAQLHALDYESKLEAANFHINICKYRHTIELMRWYGKFRNEGEYNSEGLLNIRQLLRPLYVKDQELRKAICKMPTAESLKKSKMNELKKKKILIKTSTKVLEGSVIENDKSINEQMFGAGDSNEFFILMLEPGSCLLRPRNYVNAAA